MTRSDLEEQVINVISVALADSTGNQNHDVTVSSPVDRRLGLDSLGWAAVIVRLEADLGVDPFRSGAVGELQTVSDIVDLYHACLKGD